jgi:CubicO group peptidase (beta-lactamase class C family)
MATITRRTALKYSSAGALSFINSPLLRGLFASVGTWDDAITSDERKELESLAKSFMHAFAVPGLSVAIAQDGQLLFQEVFGVANRETGEIVSIDHLFRIASVSKTFTSVGIFKLIETNRLESLQRKVFGPDGVLGSKFGTVPYRKYVEDITIDHLLTHTCGGWEKGTFDPMFCWSKFDVDHLISWTVDNRPLDYPPGDHYAYSNFGYCLLGRVIEVCTGQKYSDYVKREILDISSIADMQIGKNKKSERFTREVVYYGQNGEDPYDVNLERLDSAGGWIATATDLVRFAMSIGTILNQPMIDQMTTPTSVHPSDSRGWNLSKDKIISGDAIWFHNGSLPGTTSEIMRISTGVCLGSVANTRHQPSDAIDTALHDTLLKMASVIQGGA